jgi:uncharacterized protein DUF4342
MNSGNNREEYRVSGEDLVDKIKELVHEGNIRRIIIKNEEGTPLLEIPLTLGVIGAALLPVWAAIGAIAAMAANYTIVVERAGEQGAYATSTQAAGAAQTQAAPITNINIPYPDTPDRHLWLAVGACRLRVAPGDGEMWITGTYDDPSQALPLEIIQEGGTVKITQRQDFSGMMRLFSRTPTLDLALGKSGPYTLTLETGASESRLSLGGLPMSRLTVRQGAGKVDADYSAPNPEEMGMLDISSGASGIELRNLANANFAVLNVEGGAASYKLDFGGTLRRDADVKIATGVASVELIIPASTAAKIRSQTIMGGINADDGFTRMEGGFWTRAAVDGARPILNIQASITLGSLQLRTT